jgi:AmmeMemoRadiSam system protein B
MSRQDRPRLRPGLGAEIDRSTGQHVIVYDQLRLSRSYLRLNVLQFEAVKLFDGTRTLLDVQMRLMRLAGGQVVPLQIIEQLAGVLDEAMFLDSPRYRAAVDAPIRPPVCVGVYDEDPQALREQFRDLFDHPRSSGHPNESRDDGKVRAALLPHIDYARGGISYTWPLKEVVESTPAKLFVIVGTSHYRPQNRFTLTRKHFQTPLGVVPTDQEYVDRLAERYGDGLFEAEIPAHFPEHSIELEVVLLQYLYENKRDFRIVPLLVGSFGDCVRSGRSPGHLEEVRRMVEALTEAEREAGEPVCYLISGDLAHVGPKFDDPAPVSVPQLEHSRRQDESLMRHAERADADGYFEAIAEEGDERRICGLSPTWLTLTAARPARGRLVHYDQYVHPEGYESVSFAGMVFEK